MANTRNMPVNEIEQDLELAARESVNYLVKAFRGAVRLEEKEQRALLTAASATIGAYTRNRATTSAMQQTALVRARLLADAETGPTVLALLASGDGD